MKVVEAVRRRQNLEIQILKVEPYRHFEGQKMGCKRKKGIKDDFKIFALGH